jgi:hypothetical protein
VRAECAAEVRRLSRLTFLTTQPEQIAGAIAAAIDALDLGGPPA